MTIEAPFELLVRNPQRLAIPGFIRAERWLGVEDPKIAVATYELENIAVLKSPPYLAIAGENLSPWSKRVIGLPSVVRFGSRLALFYDGVEGEGTSHMKRDIGVAWLRLPLMVPVGISSNE